MAIGDKAASLIAIDIYNCKKTMTINIAINFTLVKVYCHKFVGMEIWNRPRATYPGSP